MLILTLKTLHVVSIIVWMGVLLYMPRLFMYQLEASNKAEPDRSILLSQYKQMAKFIWMKIGWPAALLSIIFGLGIMHPYFSSIWFWVKMGFVVALLGYHHIIHFANKALQNDKFTKTIDQYKSMSHAGVIFLLSIVALAIFKDGINQILIVGGVVVGVILIFLAVRSLIKNTSKSDS